MHDAVRRHDDILRAAITARGGQVFKTVGDAFCSAFLQPQDAVAAMLDAQRALAAEDFSAVEGLRVRMALHSGSAQQREGDYFGTTVNRVARLLAIGHGGQILLSRATVELLEGRLSPPVSLKNLGSYHLKDFADDEQVHQLLAPGMHAEFPPLRSLGTLPADLAVVDTHEFYEVPGFSGRTDELRQIDAALTDNDAIAVVHGLGGVGKSSIARAYGWLNRDRYSVVWWLNAQHEDGIIDALLRFGAMFVQGLDQLADRRAGAQRVINAILTGFERPMLLVYDNLEDEHLLHTWRPRSGARVLVTSRNAAWSTNAGVIALGVWSEDIAIEYLMRESGRADLTRTDAQAIAQTLGSLPLAMAHAAASLRNMRMIAPQQYRERIGDYLKNAPPGVDYPNSVFATFTAAIAQAEQQAEGSSALLCLAASFAPDAIPEGLLFYGSSDEMRLAEALGALDRLSLLRFAENSRTYSLHRLVQLAARDLRGNEAPEWISRAVEAADAAFPKIVEFANWPKCERILPHARAALESLPVDAYSLPSAALANRCAAYLTERADYAAAEPLFVRALATLEQLLDADHPEIAQNLHDLGVLHWRQARSQDALEKFTRALEIRQRVFGPEHGDVAQTLGTIANVYCQQGRWEDAEALHQRALEIREKVLGAEHPGLASSLNNLAGVYQAQKRYDEAEPLHRRAMKIWEATLGSDHPDLGRSLSNIARIYHDQGRYDEAEPLYLQALTIRENAFGPDHPDIANGLNNLGEMYVEQGRYDEAEALNLRALAIREKVLGADSEHPDVAISLHELARLYEAQGRWVDALPLYARVLEIREKVLGADHPDTLAVRKKLET